MTAARSITACAALLLALSPGQARSQDWSRSAPLRQSALFSDLVRSLHAEAVGYLDIFHAQSVTPRARQPRPYGELHGFLERRRLALGLQPALPAAASPLRLGAIAAVDQGGWTDDTYLLSPDGNRIGSTGLAWGAWSSWRPWNLTIAGGGLHATPTRLDGPLERSTVAGATDDAWGILRWHRFGVAAAGTPSRLRTAEIGYLPRVESGSAPDRWSDGLGLRVHWLDAAWNPWRERHEVAAEAVVPAWQELARLRLQAGSAGFQSSRLEIDIHREGLVGLDLGACRVRGEGWLPSLRIRIPLVTLSWNDPDDLAALGPAPRQLLWSARMQFVFEDEFTFYAPGRRPSAGSP